MRLVKVRLFIFHYHFKSLKKAYKLLNEYRKKEELSILDRYQLIFPTVLNSPIKIFSTELNPKASLIAVKIRHSGHSDFMDCWIAASAAVLKSVFLTEDKELSTILPSISETIELTIWSWKDFRSKIFKKI